MGGPSKKKTRYWTELELTVRRDLGQQEEAAEAAIHCMSRELSDFPLQIVVDTCPRL